MHNPPSTWQLISMLLAMALIAALVELHRCSTEHNHGKSTLPTDKNTTGYEQLTQSPSTCHPRERYSL